jgi:hypothetical protein
MRGVFANSDIKKGEILVFVPYKALIDMNSIENTTLGEKMEASHPIADHEFTAADILALIILQQKDLGKEAPHYHLLNNFPELNDFPQKYDE